MKKWESKSLHTSEEAIVVLAQVAIGTRVGKVKRERASIMGAEAGIATRPARDPAKEGASGRTDHLPRQSRNLRKTIQARVSPTENQHSMNADI